MSAPSWGRSGMSRTAAGVFRRTRRAGLPTREREDAPERDERARDRLRRKALRAKRRNKAGAVVRGDLLQPLLAEGGEEVLVQVVGVVLERSLRALARGDLSGEAGEPALS